MDNDQPKPALSFFGLILLLLGFAVVREGEHFPGWWALIPCVGATLLIESGPDAWVNRNILSNRIAVGIGLISYPLYLWHWPLLSFARIVESANPNINIRMALVTLTFALAAVTYLFIERPIRNSPQIRKNVTALVGAMSLVGLAGLTAFAYNGLGVLRPIDTNMAKVNEQFVGALWKYTSNDACMHRFPYPASKAYGWWFCSLSKDAEPTVLLLGTSFANQLYPGLAHESLLARQNILSIGACDAGMIDAPPAGSSTASLSPCTPERRYDSQGYIDNIVSSANGLKFVIVAGLSATPNAEYISQLQRRIDFLETAGANVIVFTPHIRVNYDVKGCFARPFKRPAQTCHISEDEKKAWDAGFAPLIAAVKKSNPRVQFFDQNILACRSGEGCSIILDGLPLVRDQYQHLSEFGSDRLAALFAEWSKVNAPALLN